MPPLLILLAVLSSEPAAPPPSEVTGAVSPLLPNLCRPLDASTLRCAGLVGADVFLRGQETARELAVGLPEGFTPPPPKGASFGRSVTWRLLGDRPLAALLRLRVPGEPDVLVVVKPARDGRPGCPVGAVEDGGVEGSAPERAAAFADRRAPLFRCGVDRAGLEGPWSPAGRARIAAWLGVAAPAAD